MIKIALSFFLDFNKLQKYKHALCFIKVIE